MSYVICQARPAGKSARADQATTVALVKAMLDESLIDGPYLEWSDPDAKDGFGDDRWTNDLARAKRFATFSDAAECWKAQSKVRPIRDDGKPNRPMTAYSVSIKQVEP